MALVKACCLTAPSHYLNHVSWKVFSGIHMGAILQEIILLMDYPDTCSDFTLLKLLPHPAGANELTYSSSLLFQLIIFRIRYLDSAYHQPDFNPKEPYKVPSFLGCAIAVRRDFFQHLGGFDPALELWGGENFELGFQAWLCGDGAYTHPCSRVGHVFRPLPYTIENKERSIGD